MNFGTIRVKCDAPGCGWSEIIEATAAMPWHRAPCPSCGAGDILSDHDLSVLFTVMGMIALGVARPTIEGQPISPGSVRVRVDTAGTGNGQDITISVPPVCGDGANALPGVGE